LKFPTRRRHSVEPAATAPALKLLVGEEGCILADLLSLKHFRERVLFENE